MSNLIKQKTKTLVLNKMTDYALLFFIFALAFSYIYFVNVTIHIVTLLEKTKKEMRSLSLNVSEMESQRLLMENNLNIAKAGQLGFVEVDNPIFIMKNFQKSSLSLKTD